jgi:hypothetical protein
MAVNTRPPDCTHAFIRSTSAAYSLWRKMDIFDNVHTFQPSSAMVSTKAFLAFSLTSEFHN